MERTSDVIWRPQPYISQSFDGMDQTANFRDYDVLWADAGNCGPASSILMSISTARESAASPVWPRVAA